MVLERRKDLLQTLNDLKAWNVSLIAQTGIQFDLSTPCRGAPNVGVTPITAHNGSGRVRLRRSTAMTSQGQKDQKHIPMGSMNLSAIRDLSTLLSTMTPRHSRSHRSGHGGKPKVKGISESQTASTFPSRNEQVEQSRASAFLIHQFELAE